MLYFWQKWFWPPLTVIFVALKSQLKCKLCLCMPKLTKEWKRLLHFFENTFSLSYLSVSLSLYFYLSLSLSFSLSISLTVILRMWPTSLRTWSQNIFLFDELKRTRWIIRDMYFFKFGIAKLVYVLYNLHYLLQ